MKMYEWNQKIPEKNPGQKIQNEFLKLLIFAKSLASIKSW